MSILTLNCRSSSVRYQLFDQEKKEVLARGMVERVEIGDSYITLEAPGRVNCRKESDCPDHRAAVALILQTLTDGEVGILPDAGPIMAVGHRVVHGGENFTRSSLIDDRVLAAVKAVEELAPLHNAPNIAGIDAARALLPHIDHVAVFDTAFHQTMPPHAYLYALPYEWYEKYGVRRYGFHGASHLYALKRGAELLKKRPEECNMITIHIGNGVSLCAVRNGISIDTSMGLTPLEGAVMETRCGDIDPGILVFIMQAENLSARELDRILNQKSGMLGITGRFSRQRDVLEGAIQGDRGCRLALDMTAYRLKKYIGAYCAVVGPLDAVVFVSSVGRGEWPVRELALEGMEAFGIRLDRERNLLGGGENHAALVSADDSPVRVFVVPADEDLILAENTAAVLAGEHPAEVPEFF
ncbi:MAG: acetate [Geobacteraceae bacterium]|nr:MAG: acetate [Geobacteraceae bacterium]